MNNQPQSQPLISKSNVLRILSELVRSYAGCAKVISQHVYKAADFLPLYQTTTPVILDDCTALAYLLDNFLTSNHSFGDKDCPALCKLLIVALASCNHCLDSQNALVQEVKMALNRAINMPESSDKQNRIQAFASIINTMIETCPPINNPAATGQQQGFRQPPPLSLVNNMMKIMHKKGLINDLARVPLYMDLSSSKCIDTINTILKPLETMTKTLNISARKPYVTPAGAKVTSSGGGVRLPIASVATTTTNNAASASSAPVASSSTTDGARAAANASVAGSMT